MAVDSIARKLARGLFFTNRQTVKLTYGGTMEIEGVFLNWLGRNLPLVVLGGWAALMLAFALIRA
jgi:hypothetical protein